MKKQAAATLRSRTAGSKGESRCGAIHKFKRNVKVEIRTSAAKAALRFEFLCRGQSRDTQSTAHKDGSVFERDLRASLAQSLLVTSSFSR
jgi:hypothetical protein